MRYLIYADGEEARALREKLRGEKHTAILCNPEHFAPADVREADVVVFSRGHRYAEQVEVICAAPFPQGHPRHGQSISVEWLDASKKDKNDSDQDDPKKSKKSTKE